MRDGPGRWGLAMTGVLAASARAMLALEEATMFKLLLWLLLLAICWPLALLALVLYPLVWLVTLPFRVVGIAVEGVFELLRAIVLLPARVLGAGPHRA